MQKFWGIVYSMIDNADVALEVVDARFPSICRSNQLEKYVLQSDHCRLLLALNKCDLLPRDHLQRWVNWLTSQGIPAVAVSAKDRLSTTRLRQAILRTSKRKTALVAVVGLPNTGKSSLINTLSGRAAAGVAPIPGKTRGEQKVKVSNSIRMFDTPGVIPVQLPEKHNILLGLTPITQIDDVEWAAGVLYEQSMELNPGLVASYYNVPENPKTFLDLLAESRKFLLKGGTPDTVAAARLFLADHVRAKFVIHEQVERPLRLSG